MNMVTRAGSAGRIRSIIGGATGNLVEWFDWYVYSAFALYFAPHFFPDGDRTTQLLNTAAVFAGGFVMRPVGAWIMGVYADRHGRKAGLTLSVTLMCAGSAMIALLPGRESIGMAAPALLVLARLIQGLSVGGEYGASATYLSEMAGRDRRGFFSSFQYVTLIAGQLLALAVLITLQWILTEAQMEDWGWRIPFAIGAVLAILVYRLRRGLAETESFAAGRRSGEQSGLWLLVARHPREVATVMLLTAGGTLAFYAYSIYMQKFLFNTSGFSREVASRINAATLFGFMLLQPLAGALSDRIGRRPLMIAFGIAGVVGTWPVFVALETVRSPWVAGMFVMAALVAVTGYTSINAVVKAELFPAHIRALGVALPYAISNALFGGTAEYIALWFKDQRIERGFYVYVSGMIAVSLIVYWRMAESSVSSRIIED